LGCFPILIAFIFIVIPLCVVIEKLAKVNDNVLKIKKYLEENIFDGPGGGK